MEQVHFIVWISLRVTLMGLAVFFLVRGLEQLLFDALYLIRVGPSNLARRRSRLAVDTDALEKDAEQSIAVMIPTWNEPNKIRSMLRNLFAAQEYENYRVFVGAYADDQYALRVLRTLKEKHSNLELVVVPERGPGSKAACLNYVYHGVQRFELEQDVKFRIFMLLEPSDLVHPLTMRFANHFIPEYGLVQLPLFALAHPWKQILRGVLLDDLAESYSKDAVVREWISKLVPSSGTGTALARDAIVHISEQHDSWLFRESDLSPAYQLGIDLMNYDGRKMVLQQFVQRHAPGGFRLYSGIPPSSMEPVAICKDGPVRFTNMVKQKARWLLVSSLLGWRAGFSTSLGTTYMMMRDRLAFPLGFLYGAALVVAGYAGVTALLHRFLPGFVAVPLIESHELWYDVVLGALSLLGLRMMLRTVVVGRLYGPAQALLSIPRRLPGYLVHTCASFTALRWFFNRSAAVPSVWQDIERSIPDDDEDGEAVLVKDEPKAKLGDVLLSKGTITLPQLNHALEAQKESGKPLGEILVKQESLEEEDLVFALAEQRNETAVEIDPLATPHEVLGLIPRSVAERYHVFPIRTDGNRLILATDLLEDDGRSEELSTILGRPVDFNWTSSLDIRFAVEQAYSQLENENIRLGERLGARLIREGAVTEDDLKHALRKQKRTKERLGDILVEMGVISKQDLADYLEEQHESLQKAS